MSEKRRLVNDGYNYDFKRTGAFGIFDTDSSVPIEFIMTSFTISELPHLSLARDLYSELNFDYLIQRDIDEERALSEISQYIYAKNNQKQKEVVFLPPLLAVVVNTDSQDNIISTYPDSKYTFQDDQYGGTHTREWPGVFKVENYPAQKGFELNILNSQLDEQKIRVTASQVELSLNLSPRQMDGAKLVVIDGQHRLYALNYLRREHFEKVKNIVLPVCISYSPKSIASFAADNSDIPNMQSVMRKLFVDVNSTVERVSGHFLTLLKDDSLGSIICRDFCNQVLNNPSLAKEGLGLVEWNTKNHKESLNISREHTTTSIGVINSAFEEVFNNNSGVRLINEMLKIDENITCFDFGSDEYDSPKSKPLKFPIESITLKHKSKLTELVSNNFVKHLIEIFFFSESYKVLFTSFKDALCEVLERIIADRRPSADSAYLVINNLIFNDPIDNDQKKAKELRAEFYNVLNKKRKGVVPDILRKAIFQKAIIEAWSKILEVVLASGASAENATSILILALDESVNNSGKNFDFRQPYIQSTIYNSSNIKVTKETRKQLSRLILTTLSSENIKAKISDFVSDNCTQRLIHLSAVEFSAYVKRMTSDKKKGFEKNYKVNFSVSAFDRERLIQLELERDEKLVNAKTASERNIASEPFDKAVMDALSPELDLALDALQSNFKIKSGSLIFIADEFEDD